MLSLNIVFRHGRQLLVAFHKDQFWVLFFFILFINDIGSICDGSSVTHKLFADDLKLYSNINTNCDCVQFQAVLNHLQQWCIDWQLHINSSKCNVIHFGHHNNNNKYFLNGNPIGAPETVTDLGVDIDPLLKFDYHINKIINKAYSRLGILFRGFASREVHLLKQAIYNLYSTSLGICFHCLVTSFIKTH